MARISSKNGRESCSPVAGLRLSCTVLEIEVLRIDLNAVGKTESNFLVNRLDERIKELFPVNFTVCLLSLENTFSKQTVQLTSFVKY